MQPVMMGLIGIFAITFPGSKTKLVTCNDPSSGDSYSLEAKNLAKKLRKEGEYNFVQLFPYHCVLPF